MNTPDPNAPDQHAPDPHLDGLLAAWGQRHALTPTRAEEIRHAIVRPQPAELPVTWWMALSAQVTAAIVQAGSHADRTALAVTAPSYA